MRFVSTRGGTPPVEFQDAVMMGQADDGGLLVPESIPDVSGKLQEWAKLSFKDLAVEVIKLYATDIPLGDLQALIDRSYSTFDTPLVCPLAKLKDFDILELWHGPTLAFKDVALQFLGNLFEYILKKRDGKLNILGATSGDTGSAAIHGVRGKPNINIFIMHPHNRTSELQRMQMTTVLDDNVVNVAVEGSFDDCQELMKGTFNQLEFKRQFSLGAINSVNFARILAQITYYFFAYYQSATTEPLNFCVPTGNFGNILAGYLAKRMGLPVGRLILATNENDILARFFKTGNYSKSEVQFTLSPSMDIQVASNFERYLYYRCSENAAEVRRVMAEFSSTGTAVLPGTDSNIIAESANSEQTVTAIRELYSSEGYLLDPHTAVGVSVATRVQATVTGRIVVLATAHPAKFPGAISEAIGQDIARHPALEELKGRPTRFEIVPKEQAKIIEIIRRHVEK